MRGEQVDGQDVEAVADATASLLDRARTDREPAVLEVVTYRYRGHSVADAGWSYRSKDEVQEHQRHDPIDRAAERLGIEASELDQLRERAEARVNDAVEFAENSDEPDVGSLAEHVYGDPRTDDQFERMLSGAPFGEGSPA
jgi:pyruvate dehydrogenase E1 component alpha subunit